MQNFLKAIADAERTLAIIAQLAGQVGETVAALKAAHAQGKDVSDADLEAAAANRRAILDSLHKAAG